MFEYLSYSMVKYAKVLIAIDESLGESSIDTSDTVIRNHIVKKFMSFYESILGPEEIDQPDMYRACSLYLNRGALGLRESLPKWPQE